MRLSEWIKSRLEDLKAMMSPDVVPPIHCNDGGTVEETRSTDQLDLKFCTSRANVSAVRKSIEQFSKDCGLDSPASEEVGLVVNEALANVIRHACGGAGDKPVELSAHRIEGGVKINMRDWGNGFDPSKLPPRDHDPLTPGGIGLICIRRLMDEVKYIPQPDGMLLTMTRVTPGSKAGA